MPANDDDPAAGDVTHSAPDAHGQAALLLVESLMHGLRERSLLTIGEIVDIVETAVAVQADMVDAADGDGARMRQSHALLSAIARTFGRGDIGSDGEER